MSKDTSKTVNVFLGLMPDLEDVNSLNAYLNTLRKKESMSGFNWHATEDLHITLLYFPNLPVSMIDYLEKSFRATIKTHAFEVSFSELVFFHSALVMRVQQVNRLKELRSDFLSLLSDSQCIESDTRAFNPHMTLGRINAKQVITDDIIALNEPPMPTVRLNRASLMIGKDNHHSCYRLIKSYPFIE